MVKFSQITLEIIMRISKTINNKFTIKRKLELQEGIKNNIEKRSNCINFE